MSQYHVVCRACTFERLTESEPQAMNDTEIHRRSTAHTVEYAEVTA